MARLTREDLDRFHDYDIHVPSRTIYLGSVSETDGQEDGVNYAMAERAIKNLHMLDQTTDQEITIILNSTGGDFTYGQAIYDAILSCKNTVTIKVNGWAASAGSFILQAGDDRLMHENSWILLHYGTDTVSGHHKDVQNWAEWSKKTAAWMENVYFSKILEANPKFTKAKLKELLTFDRLLNPTEALEIGLIDGIITRDGIIRRGETEDGDE